MKRFTLVLLITLILPAIAFSVSAQVPVPQESKLDRILREADEKKQQAEQVKRKTAERYKEIESYYVKLKGMDKIEESTLSSESKVEAWSEFINKYSTDNPRLGEAQEKLKFWEKMARLSVDERGKENVSSNNIYMGYDLSLLPPGLQHCRDKVVALVYGDIMRKWTLPDNQTIINRLTSTIRIAREQVDPRSKYLEPALYLAAERFNRTPGKFHFFETTWKKELLPVNAPLYFFAIGLNQYFNKWIYKTKTSISNDEIEKNFLKSIYTSVNVPVDKVSEKVDMFYSASLIDKEREIEDIVSKLIKLGPGDKKSYEPANAYNRRLVASWSSFMLANQLGEAAGRYVAGEDEGRYAVPTIINENLEIPIRELDKDFHQRGPPNYFHSKY